MLERVLFRRVREVPINGSALDRLIGILDNVVHVTWGPDPRTIDPPLSTVFRIGEVTLPATRLLVVVTTLRRPRRRGVPPAPDPAGKAVRATARDREAAALAEHPHRPGQQHGLCGRRRVGAVAGGLLAAVFPVDPALGNGPLIKGFIVMIIGGAASPLGRLLGGVLLGMVEAFGTTAYSSVTADFLAFGVLLVILYVRPTELHPGQRRPKGL